jgi:PIN domain nuclease of toxin-antitoxin system
MTRAPPPRYAHALLWWFEGNPLLSASARAAIDDDEADVLVSAVSAWEIATKHRLGKLPAAAPIVTDIAGAIAREGFAPLALTVLHAQTAGALPGHHRDPFDRMLIAQAMLEGLVPGTRDRMARPYGIPTLGLDR